MRHRTGSPSGCGAEGSGTKLGNPTNIREAGAAGRSSLIEAADDHARNLLPLLRTLRAEGTKAGLPIEDIERPHLMIFDLDAGTLELWRCYTRS
jgi:hypothetical protein